MSRRPGMSTVELVVSLTIAGILSASIGALLRRQQRFYTRAALAVDQRVSLRDATSILPGELRALSPAGGDVLAFSDSSLDIRAAIGAAVVCAVGPDGTTVDLNPTGHAAATVMASFSTSPQPGDIALVYGAAMTDDSLDDGWLARDVVSTSARDDTCTASPLVPVDLADVSRIRLGLASSLPASVRSGSFVHVVRRVRYRLYRASTGDWYLGYSEWGGASFSVVQPVSGPFAPYSRRAVNTGLLLRYFDGDGGEVTSQTDVRRITRVEIVARSAEVGQLSDDTTAARDAQDITVGVRNR